MVLLTLAAIALSGCQASDSALDNLILQLASEIPSQRTMAFDQLRKMGPIAIPRLKAAVRTGGKELGERVRLLQNCYEIQSQLTSALLLVQPPVDLRLATGGVREWTRVFLDVIQNANDRSMNLHKEDLEVLGKKALQGADTESEKLSILNAIQRFGLSQTAKELIHNLASEDDYICGKYAEVLGKVDAKEAIPQLLKMLSGNRMHFVPTVPEALGDLDAREAIPELRRILRGSQLDAVGAATALAALGVRDAGPEMMHLLKQEALLIRVNAINALTELKTREAMSEILTLTKDPSPIFRSAVLRFLGSVGGEAQIQVVAAELNDTDSSVRVAAIKALGHLQLERVVPLLIEQVHRGSADDRCAIVDALDNIGSDQAVAGLQMLLGDEDSLVRFEAARALCLRGDIRGVREIIKQSKGFFCLNAIMLPDLWKTLGVITMERRLVGLPHEVLQMAAKESGLNLDWRIPAQAECIHSWASRAAYLPRHCTLQKVLSCIESAGPCSVILQEGKLVVLPAQDASTFWKEWMNHQK